MKIVVFDIDDTLTTDGSWERLNAAAGLTPEEDYALYSAYFKGDFDYQTWTQKLENLYKERNKLSKELANQILTTYTLRDGAKETIHTLKALGHKIIFITGGFKDTAEHIANELGVEDFFYVTDIQWNDAGTFLNFRNLGEEGEAKLNLLKTYCQNNSEEITNCAVVGDGPNDLPMFRSTSNDVKRK